MWGCKQPRTGAAFFCWRFYFWCIGSPASSLVQVLHFFAGAFICGALGRLGNCSLHRLSAYSWCPIHPRPCGDASSLVQVLHFFAGAFICGALGRLQAASYW